MGTNYYVRIKPEKAELQKALDNEDWGALRAGLPKQVHIGKSSYGWQFIFNHNDGKHYKRTRASIDAFIRSGQLVDEYECPVMPEDFWLLVDAKKDHLCEKSYLKKHPSINPGKPLPFWANDVTEFFEDGLRFSDSADFS